MRILRSASLVMLLTVAACGGGGGDESDGRRDRDTDTSEVDSTSDDSGGSGRGVINDKMDVSRAVVRIVAEGSFRDPEFGQQSFVGSGSGFIISSDGLVVTNQHVVEGAGSLEVYIEGEDRPKNARILGVSECNDLAVLDLEGEDYPYLDWYRDEPEPGIDTWAAGYPLGDPEYSLTRGSVVKAEANGDTSWASIEYSLEHDANIQPGNSGGALVTEEGRVIGVVYANSDAGTGTSQFYAIPAALAKPIVETLSEGQDQDSIGINGIAISYQDIAGVWVNGVRAGSAASDLGLKAGDIVLELGGRPVVTESDINEFGATKAGYCDVLRTQGTDRAISIKVLRFDTGEVLSGELNNPDRPLEVEISLASQISQDAGGAGFSYELISDDTRYVEVEVPTEWTDRSGGSIDFLGFTLPAVSASTDLDSFFSTWDTPGISVIAAPELTTDDFVSTLDFFAPDECVRTASDNFEGKDLIGVYDVYENCGGISGVIFVVGAFYDSFYESMVIVLVQVNDASQLEVIDQALNTVYLP